MLFNRKVAKLTIRRRRWDDDDTAATGWTKECVWYWIFWWEFDKDLLVTWNKHRGGGEISCNRMSWRKKKKTTERWWAFGNKIGERYCCILINAIKDDHHQSFRPSRAGPSRPPQTTTGMRSHLRIWIIPRISKDSLLCNPMRMGLFPGFSSCGRQQQQEHH